MSIRLLTRHDAKQWNAVLDRMIYDVRDVHFTPEYAAAYEALYPGSMACMFVMQDGIFTTAQPFLLRPKPIDVTSIGFGGPITDDPFPSIESAQAFRHEFVKMMIGKGAVSEFCLYNPMFSEMQGVSPPGGIVGKRVVVIPTENIFHERTDDYPLGPSHGRLSDMAAAVGAGVKTRVSSMGEFVELYGPAMERLQASKRWRLPREYFTRLVDLQVKGMAEVIVATLDEKIQTAGIFLRGKSAFYYHLAASIEGKARGSNDIVIGHASDMASAQACRWLFLGGGVTRRDDDPVLKYKRSFGGLERPLVSTATVLSADDYERLTVAAGTVSADFFPAYRAEEAR